MIKGFYEDLREAQKAEQLVLETLQERAPQLTFLAVGTDREYFHKGDIKVVANNGKENFIEVKNDSVIYKTGNILLEDEVYYKDNDWYGKGNLHSDYEYYAIVSEQERRIYILDFSILREASHLGEYKVIEHPSQITYCYLLPLGIAKAKGAVITTLNY